MNKDQVSGRAEEAGGQVKKAVGKILGIKTLEEKGKLEKVGGKVQSGFGDSKNDLKNKR
ncbi:CsbD family protein [Paralcaligenes sp. KSB-10]|uniref:CsbD family protein n=1 Tax=Paralcaligenes sp. KSB-10 TaxID=2901142 RepID=UPI001E3C2A71|nr:CsbD family protein [Paralcaligenes sp. KSB-10]UHL64834.1 CsbD family protein [Paralcaligenes sp. KSB-10]